MRSRLFLLVLIGAAFALSGCFRADVRLPRNIGVGAPPSDSAIPGADPTDRADLLRENHQLRRRVAWLEEQIRDAAKDFAELENDERKIRNDMLRVAAQRDRYLRAAGR